MWTPDPDKEMTIWHYYMQSKQDYQEKISRGSVLNNAGYNVQKFQEEDARANQRDTRMKDR